VIELLGDGGVQVPEGRQAESVHVEQKVVEIEPLGAMRRPGGMDRATGGVEEGPMPLQRLSMMLVLRPVEGPAVRTDEGRVEVLDGIVRPPFGGIVERDAIAIDLPAEPGMYRSIRVLELADRATGNVLDDRLQIPARAAARRALDGRLTGHEISRPPGPL
jgi:hypothetical protein